MNRAGRIVSRAFALCTMVLLSSSVHASTLVGGTTPANCFSNLLGALSAASPGTVIIDGNQCPTIAFGSTIIIAADATVATVNGPVTLDGQGLYQLFRVNAGVTFNIAGTVDQPLTLTRGRAVQGGAIRNMGTLSVTDAVFKNNDASYGGAIYNDGVNGSPPGCVVSRSATLYVSNATFSANSAVYFGGAIVNYVPINGCPPTATLVADNVTFSGNRTSNGFGGALTSWGMASISNATFAGNTASRGGGIWNGATGIVDLVGVTLARNSAPLGGSALYASGAPVDLANTLLATGPQECFGPVNDHGGNISSDWSCAFTALTSISGSWALASSLGGLADNGGPTQTIALGPNSPAIGAGLQEHCLAEPVNNLDQRGSSRNADTRGECDIGAYDTGGPSDTIAPVLHLPPTTIVAATSPAGAVVTYSVTATDPDSAPGQITIICTPSSGYTFPIGTTTVNCSASDPAGNTSTGSFQVVVKGAAEQIGDLIGLVNSFGLPFGQQTSLNDSLIDALTAAQAGRIRAACGNLTDFIDYVSAQAGKKLTAEQAQQLLAAAMQIRAVLAC